LKNIIYILLVLSLTSCENKMLNRLNSKQNFYANLQQTQKIILSNSKNETKAMLSVTYLHPKEYLKHKSSKIQKFRGERFIIGTFFADGNSSLSMDLNNSYSLTLGRKRVKNIKELSLDDSLLIDIPMLNGWSRYYLVQFDYKARKRFNMVFSHKEYGIKRVKFYKVAKYLFNG